MQCCLDDVLLSRCSPRDVALLTWSMSRLISHLQPAFSGRLFTHLQRHAPAMELVHLCQTLTGLAALHPRGGTSPVEESGSSMGQAWDSESFLETSAAAPASSVTLNPTPLHHTGLAFAALQGSRAASGPEAAPPTAVAGSGRQHQPSDPIALHDLLSALEVQLNRHLSACWPVEPVDPSACSGGDQPFQRARGQQGSKRTCNTDRLNQSPAARAGATPVQGQFANDFAHKRQTRSSSSGHGPMQSPANNDGGGRRWKRLSYCFTAEVLTQLLSGFARCGHHLRPGTAAALWGLLVPQLHDCRRSDVHDVEAAAHFYRADISEFFSRVLQHWWESQLWRRCGQHTLLRMSYILGRWGPRLHHVGQRSVAQQSSIAGAGSEAESMHYRSSSVTLHSDHPEAAGFAHQQLQSKAAFHNSAGKVPATEAAFQCAAGIADQLACARGPPLAAADLALVAWGACSGGYADRGFLRSSAPAIATALRGMDEQRLHMVLVAYATAGLRHEQLMKAAANTLLHRLEGSRGAESASGASKTSNSLDHGVGSSDSALGSRFDIASLPILGSNGASEVGAAARNPRHLLPSTLCDAAWAFAKLRCADVALLAPICDTVLPRVHELTAESASRLAWACALTSCTPGELFHR